MDEGDDGDAGAAQLAVAREHRRMTELVLYDDVGGGERGRQRTQVRRDGPRTRAPWQGHHVDDVTARPKAFDEQSIVDEAARDAGEITEEHEGDSHGGAQASGSVYVAKASSFSHSLIVSAVSVRGGSAGTSVRARPSASTRANGSRPGLRPASAGRSFSILSR